MAGFAVGGQCIGEVAQAASLACASFGGPTSAGVVTCQDASIDAQTLTFQRCTSTGTTTECRPDSFDLPACEAYDWSYWSPVLGAFFLALVSIVCTRMLFLSFRKETL